MTANRPNSSPRRRAPRNARHAARLVPLLAVLLAPLLCGCAFEDGIGFARLSATVEARFEALDPGAGRLVEDGWLRTARSYELRVDRLSLDLAELALLGAAAAGGTAGTTEGGACAFDPAAPPEGCTLCHGGHCHCGAALVSYEDLERQVCGVAATAATPAVLARLPGRTLELAAAEGAAATPLNTCLPSCELGAGEAVAVRAAIGGLRLQGRVRDRSRLDRFAGTELALRVDLALDGAELRQDLPASAPLDRASPYDLLLRLALLLPATLLDGVDWASLQRAPGAALHVDAANNTALGAEPIAGELAAAVLAVELER